MNLNPHFRTCLKLPVKPEEYTGTSTEYILFNYADERDEMYANGVPQEGVTYMQIHYYTKGDPHAKKASRQTAFAVCGVHNNRNVSVF